MSNFISLDQIPQAAFEFQNGTVYARNRAAVHLLPDLTPGTPVPTGLDLSPDASSQSGTFSYGGASYQFQCTVREGRALVLVLPAPQTTLTDAQLDGFLRQMRQMQSEFLLDIQKLSAALEQHPQTSSTQQLTDVRQTFFRMYHMVDNLAYLQDAKMQRLTLRPEVLDFSELCSQLTWQVSALLRPSGTDLEFLSDASPLLIPGDPALLSRALLGLLSNAVRHAPAAKLSLRLTRQSGQAILLLSQNGPITQRQMDELLTQIPSAEIASPSQGPGLGLSVIRHILSLHGGALVWMPREDRLLAAISLPDGPLNLHTDVCTPRMQENGGLPQILVELSDVLPVSAFDFTSLD